MAKLLQLMAAIAASSFVGVIVRPPTTPGLLCRISFAWMRTSSAATLQRTHRC
ncbi:hypothetical protein KSP40_PGU007743 [Platanthera guangdongensis]|uniref:Secreted protein n=1 Tax=Platanthera guangdongensis TaxID=2320717 RepID=A0ABR2LTQ2_9ASPA